MRHVASILDYKSNEELEDLYTKTAWHFERKSKKKGSSYDYFKQAVQDPSLLDECDIDEKTKSTLLENIKMKLTQTGHDHGETKSVGTRVRPWRAKRLHQAAKGNIEVLFAPSWPCGPPSA